jgi:O-methyltransferase
MLRFLLKAHYVLTAPFAILAIMTSDSIHPGYRLSLFRRLRLGVRMFWNSMRVKTLTSYKVHLAIALKILETPPEVQGDVVECGTYKGGSAANLSLICKLVNRRLLVFDSFEGLPEGKPGDREAHIYAKGDFCGQLDEVKRNIRSHGAIEVCEFVKGWFDDTLPTLKTPVILAFLDVDLEASLDTCVRYLWPRLVDHGHLFTDEAVSLDFTALFFSEKWWRQNMNQSPPGLIGAGTGLPLGEYYLGPMSALGSHALWHPNGVGYTQKGMSGVWAYYPEESRERSAG